MDRTFDGAIVLSEFLKLTGSYLDKDPSERELDGFFKDAGQVVIDTFIGSDLQEEVTTYVDLMKNVVSSETSTMVKKQAVEQLGNSLIRKFHIDDILEGKTEEEKSAAKMLYSLQDLSNAVYLVKDVADSKDITSLNPSDIKSILTNSLSHFNLDDDVSDVWEAGEDVFKKGQEVYKMFSSGESLDGFDIIFMVQELLVGGYNLLKEIYEANDDLKAMFNDIKAGIKVIANHAKKIGAELAEAFQEFGDEMKENVHTFTEDRKESMAQDDGALVETKEFFEDLFHFLGNTAKDIFGKDGLIDDMFDGDTFDKKHLEKLDDLVPEEIKSEIEEEAANPTVLSEIIETPEVMELPEVTEIPEELEVVDLLEDTSELSDISEVIEEPEILEGVDLSEVTPTESVEDAESIIMDISIPMDELEAVNDNEGIDLVNEISETDELLTPDTDILDNALGF